MRITAFRGDSNQGWVAIDDFIFLPDIDECSIKPQGADPQQTTANPAETTLMPPSLFIKLEAYNTYQPHFQPFNVTLKQTSVALRCQALKHSTSQSNRLGI